MTDRPSHLQVKKHASKVMFELPKHALFASVSLPVRSHSVVMPLRLLRLLHYKSAEPCEVAFASAHCSVC